MSLLAQQGVTMTVQIAPDVAAGAYPEDADWDDLPQPDAITWTTAPVSADSDTPTAEASARFRDAARALDPQHAAGLTPWTWARLVVTYDATDHVVATGYVPEWPVAEGQFHNQVALKIVPVTARFNREIPSPFGWAARQAGAAGVWLLDTPGDTFTGIDGGQAGEWSTIPDVESSALIQVESGYTNFDGTLTGRIPLAGFRPPIALPLTVEAVASFTPTADVDQTYSLIESFSGANSIVVEATVDVAANTVTLTAWSSLKSTSNGIVTEPMALTDWQTGRYIAYRVTSTVEEVWVDGTPVTTTAATAPTAPTTRGTSVGGSGSVNRVNWEGAIAAVAAYRSDIGTGVIADHWDALRGWPGDRVGERLHRVLDVFEWPSGLRNIGPGVVACGPWDHTGRPLLAELRILEDTEQGRVGVDGTGVIYLNDRHHYIATAPGSTVQTTFSDVTADVVAGTKVGFSELTRTSAWSSLINDTTARSRSTGAERRYIDVVSRDEFERQPPNGDEVPTVAGTDELYAHAATRVAENKDPKIRVPQIRFTPLHVSPTDRIPIALARTVGDRVHLERTSQGVGSPIDLDLETVAATHTITRDSWTVDLHVVAARTAAGWWTPGTSKVGIDSVWAP